MSEHSREAGQQLGRSKRSVPFMTLFASTNSANDKLRGSPLLQRSVSHRPTTQVIRAC